MAEHGKIILIVGGAGFVGSHLTERLLNDGVTVVIIDDFSNGIMANLENVKDKVTVLKHDISVSFAQLKKVLAAYRFDGIFHLACHPRSLSLQNPYRDLEVNAKGTLNILELARLNDSKVVFTSNSGIYGDPEYLPIDEKHPDKPSTPYDANKLVSEYYMKIYCRIYGIPIAICRLATVYGERQRTKPEWRPVIPEFATKILRGEPPTIYWDGEQTRDLIYVKDVVQGLVKAFESADTNEEVFILGTNTEISVNQIYAITCQTLGKCMKPNRDGKVDGDIRRMKLSSEKAKRTFGFRPEYSLEQGIRNYINWLRSL
ncbi:MAG: NAD-dependent epimerase/dehydratase family protein [Chloroflexi bacterium]|nr:NAD-dependent epimerase/dehydratase family protein [Chloroflexota bacterium]